jgi:GNAT superfamily N-acetyltransferase
VLAVIVARDVEDLGAPDFTIDDLLEDWDEPGFGLAEDAWLAEDGEIAAYAVVRDREQLVLVAPRHCGRGLGSALLDRVERRALERGHQLRQHLPGRNAAAAALLAARG